MKLRPTLLAALALMLILNACNLPVAPSATVVPTPRNASTAAVMTIVAMQTRDAFATAIVNTATPRPEDTSAPTRTVDPGAPTATSTQKPCDLADFVADVTIPDGTKMTPGQQFSKTWRFTNTGACAWNSSYSMAFISGEAMGAPAGVNLPGDVPPGATVDLTINFTAPSKPGKYSSYWKFRNGAGVLFGVGADDPYYLIIEVVGPTATITNTPAVTATTAAATRTVTPTTGGPATATVTPASEGVLYDFVAAACQAEWRSAAGVLDCEGKKSDVKGDVLKLDKPVLETGDQETKPVLLTEPQIAENGAITGSYPAVVIQSGYHFRATIGCLQGANPCKVKYQLNYKEGSSTQVINLGQWSQTSDGAVQGINVDLTPLAGKSVTLILVVLADGQGSSQNQAVWIYPRITIG